MQLRSPPVPQVSTRPSGPSTTTGVTCSNMAPSSPVISSTVSPFMRRATQKAAIWADVARPSRISVIAAAAEAAGRSTRRLRAPSTAGQPPRSAKLMAENVPPATARCVPTPARARTPEATRAQAAAVLRRWRRMRRRSFSVAPPQTPSCSRLFSAYSRHGWRTAHCRAHGLGLAARRPRWAGRRCRGRDPCTRLVSARTDPSASQLLLIGGIPNRHFVSDNHYRTYSLPKSKQSAGGAARRGSAGPPIGSSRRDDRTVDDDDGDDPAIDRGASGSPSAWPWP